MELIYRPADEDVQRWTFTLGRFRSREIEEVEQLTKMEWGVPFKMALHQGSMLARRALLWTLLRRRHPKLRFSDLDPFDEEVEFTLNLDEWAELRAEVDNNKALSQANREEALAQIDRAIELTRTEAEDRARSAESAEGKAPSGTSESGTASP